MGRYSFTFLLLTHLLSSTLAGFQCWTCGTKPSSGRTYIKNNGDKWAAKDGRDDDDDDEQEDLAAALGLKRSQRKTRRWSPRPLGKGKLGLLIKQRCDEDEEMLNIFCAAANRSDDLMHIISPYIKSCRNTVFPGGSDAGLVSGRRRRRVSWAGVGGETEGGFLHFRTNL